MFVHQERVNAAIRLDRSSSALLIVDLQRGSTSRDRGWISILRAAGYATQMDAYLQRIASTVFPNVRRLQQAFRDVGASVIFLAVGSMTEDYSDITLQRRRVAEYWQSRGFDAPYARPGSRDLEIPEPIAPAPSEPLLIKTTNSAFTSSGLERVLLNRNIRELAICGVGTNACVALTLLDAVDRGFDCVLIEDACAGLTTELHETGVQIVESFCRVASTEAVVQEMAAAAGAPAPVG